MYVKPVKKQGDTPNTDVSQNLERNGGSIYTLSPLVIGVVFDEQV